MFVSESIEHTYTASDLLICTLASCFRSYLAPLMLAKVLELKSRCGGEKKRERLSIHDYALASFKN